MGIAEIGVGGSARNQVGPPERLNLDRGMVAQREDPGEMRLCP